MPGEVKHPAERVQGKCVNMSWTSYSNWSIMFKRRGSKWCKGKKSKGKLCPIFYVSGNFLGIVCGSCVNVEYDRRTR